MADAERYALHMALARTALLLRLDAFPGLGAESDRDIVDGLRSMSVRIVSDRANLASPNGQTALVTLVCQCAMLGVRIDLDIPDVPQLISQPPLPTDLPIRSALVEWSEAAFPGCLAPATSPVVTLAVGDTAAAGAVHVAGNGNVAVLDTDRDGVARWAGNTPYGAIGAAAAGAAEVMRAAIPGLADLLNQPLPTDITWKPRPFTPVRLALPGTVPSTGLGSIDAVSAGAITHAALYTLLRVPGLDADVRTIDRDELGRSNTNRYALARAADIGRVKVAQLMDFATEAMRISGVPDRFDDDTLTVIGQLAPRVLVGVDDIPTRWFIQRQHPAWLGVGGTSHGFVVVSDHRHGQPCAGCVHPIDDDNPLGEIPTIGFVSLWAGLLLAGTLLEADGATRNGTRRIEAHPMGLYGPHAVQELPQTWNPRCPVCTARPSAA